MSVIRAFIALDLPVDIHARLDGVMEDLKRRLKDAPVRWVAVRNIHITIAFLGDVSVANLEPIKKILQTEAGRSAPFSLTVGGLGAFPSISRPRVIWVGVQAPLELGALQTRVEAELSRLGYTREEREFSAHLTLGRLARTAESQDARRISETLASVKVGNLGEAHIAALHLYRSDLQPGGSVYTKLFSAPFTP
jgi:2'-5' RNA ligase